MSFTILRNNFALPKTMDWYILFFIYSPPLIVYVNSKMGSVLLAEAVHKARLPVTLLP